MSSVGSGKERHLLQYKVYVICLISVWEVTQFIFVSINENTALCARVVEIERERYATYEK